jgi:hypothetical protein
MNLKTLMFPITTALAAGMLYMTNVGQLSGQGLSAEAQRTFASPGEATNDMVKAAKAHDEQAIRQIFGPEITNLMTGDKTLDESHFNAFASDLTERCDLIPEGDGKVTLEIGPERWPFPIPLIQTNGAWQFDTIAGEEEIINRHIGRDEYYAIGVCRAYVKAQRQYAEHLASESGIPAYAQRFKSTPGKMDGLYWTAETNPSSPLSSFVAKASLEGYHWDKGKGPRPFHGYFFKILTRQGPAASGGEMSYIRDGRMTRGFALVAYPVRWGESGIMTFIVNQDGVVYQRCFDEKTSAVASAMKKYNPDPKWTVVKETGITDLTANDPNEKPQ